MRGLAILAACTAQRSHALGLALVVVGMLAASDSLSRIAGWIPRSVLVVTLVLIVIQLGLDVRGRMRDMRSTEPPGLSLGTATLLRVGSTTEAVAILWVGGAFLAILLFGMTAGSALFAFAFLRGYAGENWRSSGVFALALAACLQLVFGTVLQATLYPGWLWHASVGPQIPESREMSSLFGLNMLNMSPQWAAGK
jgi:hypothetical protein